MEADDLAQPFEMLSIAGAPPHPPIDGAAVDSSSTSGPDGPSVTSLASTDEVGDLVFVEETPERSSAAGNDDIADVEDKMPLDSESNNSSGSYNNDGNPSTVARGGAPSRFMIRHIHGTLRRTPALCCWLLLTIC
jgi:hypothetical protein